MAENKHHGMVKEMLHDLQHKFGLTQVEIADYCGVAQPSISVMYNGGGARDSTYRKIRQLYAREQPKYRARILRAASVFKND